MNAFLVSLQPATLKNAPPHTPSNHLSPIIAPPSPAGINSVVDGRVSNIITLVDVYVPLLALAGGEQHVHHRHVAHLGGDVQGRAASVVSPAQLGASVEQLLHARQLVVADGHEQRRLALVVEQVGVDLERERRLVKQVA